MKKIISAILLLTLLVFSFASCKKEDPITNDPEDPIINEEQDPGENKQEETLKKLRVGYLAGPTGLGMAKLVSDNGGINGNSEKYSFKNYANNVAQAQADLTAGNIDLVCVPTNNIAAYYKSTDQNVTVLSLNALGSLYLVTKNGIEINSINDLEGKTIYTCQQGTPKTVIDTILKKAGINATVTHITPDGTEMDKPEKVGPQVIAGKIDIAVFPEPQVSNAITKNTSYKVALDLGDVWEDLFDSELTMGCIVAKKSFVAENKAAINAFLAEYKASIEFMTKSENLDTAASYAIDAQIIPLDKAVVKNAITNLGDAVAYVDGEEMKTLLKKFYTDISIPSPADEFYYEK